MEAPFSTAASLVFSCLSESSPAATRVLIIVNLSQSVGGTVRPPGWEDSSRNFGSGVVVG